MVRKSLFVILALCGLANADTGYNPPSVTVSDNSGGAAKPVQRIKFGANTTLTVSGNVATVTASGGGGGGTTVVPLPAGDTTYMAIAGTQTISGSNVFVSSTAFRSGIAISTGIVRSSTYTMTQFDSVILASSTPNAIITITLPSASVMPGQMVSVMKVDKSTAQVYISRQGSDLIGNTTGLMILSAPGQRLMAFSDGVSNWMPTVVPIQQDMGGQMNDPNGAALANAANDANCRSFTNYDFAIASSTYYSVGATAGNVDVGIYDNNGNRIASSGAQANPGTGTQHEPYSQLAYLAPGTYWKCIAVSDATTMTITRESIDGNIGTCRFTTSMPLPATLAFNGCTTSSRVYAQGVQFIGGPLR